MLQAARAMQYMQKFEHKKDVFIDIKPWKMFLDEKYQTLKLYSFNQIDDEDFGKLTKKYIAPGFFDEANYTQKYNTDSWEVLLFICYLRIIMIFSYNFDRPMFLLKSYFDDQTKIYENEFMNWLIEKIYSNKTYSRLNIHNIVEKIENHLENFKIPEVKIEDHKGKFENIL